MFPEQGLLLLAPGFEGPGGASFGVEGLEAVEEGARARSGVPDALGGALLAVVVGAVEELLGARLGFLLGGEEHLGDLDAQAIAMSGFDAGRCGCVRRRRVRRKILAEFFDERGETHMVGTVGIIGEITEVATAFH